VITPSPERELFRLRPSLLGGVLPFGWFIGAFYNWDVQVGLIPWRGCGVGVVSLMVGAWVFPRFITNEVVLFSLWFLLLVVPIALEAVNRRDLVTETAVVRQRGILGRIRHSIPLAEIERVEYSFPRWGRRWDVGDVIIRTMRGRTVFLGIKRPAATAQSILGAKARSLGLHGESVDV
jgi:membrane protein YdbS with pleckstrin-like domain